MATQTETKRVLLGVTGCIAAYKACEVLRGLQKRGVDVEVVMTESATHFVGPLTFSALSGKPVRSGFYDDLSDPIPHISAAQSCDLFLIAPCTADTLAKLAFGMAGDLLSATALACTAPLLVVPAMNVHMYENPATQHNIQILRDRGIEIMEADSGYLACGEEGSGRFPEPQRVVDRALEILGL